MNINMVILPHIAMIDQHLINWKIAVFFSKSNQHTLLFCFSFSFYSSLFSVRMKTNTSKRIFYLIDRECVIKKMTRQNESSHNVLSISDWDILFFFEILRKVYLKRKDKTNDDKVKKKKKTRGALLTLRSINRRFSSTDMGDYIICVFGSGGVGKSCLVGNWYSNGRLSNMKAF